MEQFTLGGLRIKLEKNGNRVSIEYDFAGEKYTDVLSKNELSEFIKRIQNYLASENKLDPETVKKLKAIGIGNIDYITRP